MWKLWALAFEISCFSFSGCCIRVIDITFTLGFSTLSGYSRKLFCVAIPYQVTKVHWKLCTISLFNCFFSYSVLFWWIVSLTLRLFQFFRWVTKWINSWDNLLLNKSIVSKWYHSLDDTSVYSVCSLKVKFDIDLSFIEMRRLYSIKLKKAKTHRDRKLKKELERVHERNFENFRNFPRNFQFR